MLITNQKQLRQYYTDQRIWQGIPSVEVTDKGRIFVTWYSGTTKEGDGNYSFVCMSDDGVNYSEPVVAAYVDGHRCFDPCLWMDPLGRLWFTWAIQPDDALWGSICQDPDAKTLRWSEPFKIGHNIMMNKPVVLSTGEWLFPLAVWNYSKREVTPEFLSDPTKRLSFVYKTVDNGKTFTCLGGANVPDRIYDEHMVVELTDGRLMMLVRTRYGIGVSYSHDRGKTWTRGVKSGIPNPSSRFHITRLRSGRLLMVNHVDFNRRNNLTAQLSEDDGKTWSKGILLDGRDQVSYPDAKEAADGYIYITYDRERGCFKDTMEQSQACAREILMARVTEEDILQGSLVDSGSYLQRIVSKLGTYQGPEKNPYAEVVHMSNAEYAKKLLLTCDGRQILDRIFNELPIPCFMDEPAQLDALIEAFEAGGHREQKLLEKIIGMIRKAYTPQEPNPAVTRMREYVQNNYTEDFSLQDMADALNISRYYMCHLFRKECAITILEYRNSLRITKAKQMLVNTSESIGVIAADCGFGTASYFSRIFVELEAMTPAVYRKLHKKK